MRKRNVLPWILISISIWGVLFSIFFDSEADSEPEVTISVGRVFLQPTKDASLMFFQVQPPLIDPEVNQTIILPPVDIEMLPEIPPEIDPSVLANEHRNFTVIIPEITIDARYMAMDNWWIEIRLYAHEEGVSSWTPFITENVTSTFASRSWEYQVFDENHWSATMTEPIKVYINLQYVIWKTLSDVYPLYLAIDIRAKGVIRLSCDVTGCDHMISDPYQQSIRVVAPT